MFALFIPAFLGALAVAMGSLAGRVLIALGIGFVTYKGLDFGIDQLRLQVVNAVKGMPVQTLNFLAYLWLDKALSVVFSGVVVALTMRQLGGSVKRMVAK